jgi:hypothetical protein
VTSVDAKSETKLQFAYGEPHAVLGAAVIIALPPSTSGTWNIRIAYETSPKSTAIQWLAPEAVGVSSCRLLLYVLLLLLIFPASIELVFGLCITGYLDGGEACTVSVHAVSSDPCSFTSPLPRCAECEVHV